MANRSKLRLSVMFITVMAWMVIWYVRDNRENGSQSGSLLIQPIFHAGAPDELSMRRNHRTSKRGTSKRDVEDIKSMQVVNSGVWRLGESTERLCSGRRAGATGGTTNPLCANRSSLIVFSRMRKAVLWQFYAHKAEAEKCSLPNNAICFLTDDYSYYQTADVLLARDCAKLCN